MTGGVPPDGAEAVLVGETECDVGLQEEAVAAGDCGGCGADVFASTFASRDGEDADAGSAESGAMDAGLPGQGVGVEFSGDGTRVMLRSLHWHRPAVGLQETEDALTFVGKLQGEDAVGDDAELFLSRTRHRPLKGRTLIARRGGEWDFVVHEQAHVTALPTRDFQRHHDVGNHQRVLQEEAFDGAVPRSPIEPGEGRVVHAAKMRGSAAGESVGDAP